MCIQAEPLPRQAEPSMVTDGRNGGNHRNRLVYLSDKVHQIWGNKTEEMRIDNKQ